MCVGARDCGLDRGPRAGARQIGEWSHGIEVRAVAAGDDLDAGRQRGERLGERRRVRDVDEPRLEQSRGVPQLGVVLALQRIGNRDRRDRNAGREGGEHQHRVIERVAGKNHQRPLGGEPAIDERLCDCVDLRARGLVAQLAPAVIVPLGEEASLRGALPRAPEHVCQIGIMRLELVPRAQQEPAAGKLLADHVNRCEAYAALARPLLQRL